MKVTRKQIASTFAFFFLLFAASAQEMPLNNGLGFGFQLNQYQRDFGAGLQFASPYFAKERVAVRLRGHILFHEHLEDVETTWTPYAHASLGFIGVVGYIGNIRLYSEGGLVGLFPSAAFSSERSHFGGYGLFGFEFFFNNSGNYFIEIGGVGTGAKADKVPGKPVFSNGLTIGAGFRFSLPR